MRAIYLDCFSGISGDMTLGALIDLGLDFEALRAELAKLGLRGYEIRAEKVRRGGISATKFTVEVDHRHPHERRGLSEIFEIIDSADISERAKSRAKEIFDRLAEAEARVHGVPKEEVHFHEVGAVDSIVDVVGTALALDLLGVEKVFSSPIPLGRGFTRSAHGTIPVPAPATVELLRGAPVRGTDIEAELTTPTGAAIASTLASDFGPMPPMRIESVGYGAGSRELPQQPNVLRVVMGELCEEGLLTDVVTVLETNVDDMNPEMLGYLMERLFEAGALDVFFTPIQMKKNRPAVKVSVIARRGDEGRMAELMLSETSTIGVRMFEARRLKLPREVVEVDTPYGRVKVKVSRMGEVVKIAPEYDSCKEAARKAGVPLRVVYEAALKSASG